MSRIARSLIWLVALGACLAVLRLDGSPSDPRRADAPLAASERAALVVPQIAQAHLRQTFMAFQRASQVGVPGQLAIFLAGPDETQAYAELLAALALAEDRALAEPLVLGSELRVQLHRYQKPGYESVAVLPAGDLQAVLPRLDLDEPVLVQQEYGVEWTPGGALAIGDDEAIASLVELWPEYQRALGCWEQEIPHSAVPQNTPSRPDSDVVVRQVDEVHATYALNPSGRPEVDEILLSSIHQALGVVPVRLPGGLILRAPAWDQAMVRQLLDDPRWLRLFGALELPSPRQAAALREALEDDDPLLAQAALLALLRLFDGPPLPGRTWPLPLDPHAAFRLCPHRAPTNDPLGMWWETKFLQQALETVPPAMAARELERLGRTAANADAISNWLAMAIGHPVGEVRAAAQGLFFARLPRRTLVHIDGAGREVLWQTAEREAFFEKLVDALRRELRSGDPLRAADVTREALWYADWNGQDLPQAADSRLRELGAELVFDPVLGESFRDESHWSEEEASNTAAEECLRSSDPERRRAAWRLLSERRTASSLAKTPYVGDPYLADLLD